MTKKCCSGYLQWYCRQWHPGTENQFKLLAYHWNLVYWNQTALKKDLFFFLHYHGLLRARWSLLYQKRKSPEWFAGTVADQTVVGWRSWLQRSAHRMWPGVLETDCRRLSLSAVKTIQQLLKVLGKEGTRIIIKKSWQFICHCNSFFNVCWICFDVHCILEYKLKTCIFSNRSL